MRTVIYTAIFGGYDRLREIPLEIQQEETTEDVSWICFTDDPTLRSNTWKVQHCLMHIGSRVKHVGSRVMIAKEIKVLSHDLYFNYYDRSIWIDGSFSVHGPLWNWFDQIGTNDIGLFRHTCRKCLYREIEACQQKDKDHPDVLEAAKLHYLELGHPPNWGLWMGGILLRQHNVNVESFNESWWNEIESGTSRDQISLPFVLRKTGINFHSFPTGSWRDCLQLHGHLKK